MSGYINGFQYDSAAQYSTDEIYARSDLSSDGSPPLQRDVTTNTFVDYQLSNNGQWYAGARYVQYGTTTPNGPGQLITVLSDNAAGTQWFNSLTIVYNSSHAASGGSLNDNENTILGKDGYTYVSDTNTSGSTVASAKYVTATGAYVTSSNWSPGTSIAESPGPNSPAPATQLQYETYAQFNVTDYGNPGAGPPPGDPGNPDTKGSVNSAASSVQVIDISTLTERDLRLDFTASARVADAGKMLLRGNPSVSPQPVQPHPSGVVSIPASNHPVNAAHNIPMLGHIGHLAL